MSQNQGLQETKLLDRKEAMQFIGLGSFGFARIVKKLPFRRHGKKKLYHEDDLKNYLQDLPVHQPQSEQSCGV